MSQEISPAQHFFAVTPSDSTVLTLFRSLYVGVTGDVTVVRTDGTAVLFKAVPAGTFMPICSTKVKSTGTTATDLVALY